MRRSSYAGIAALCMLAAATAQADSTTAAATDKGAVKATPRPVRSSPDPLVGMVINRTITVLGREFYQHFAAVWRDLPESERYSVSVHERPTAIRGSQVWVLFGQRRVFQAYLSPARAAAKSASQRAAEISYKNVLDIEVARMLFQDRDLGPEEI